MKPFSKHALREIVEMAYKPAYQPNSYWQPWRSDRVITEALLPEGEFDFVSATQESPQEALQSLLKEKFGVTARCEMREVDVLVLNVKSSPPPGLKLAQKSLPAGVHRGGLTMRGDSLGMLASQLENGYKMPVIDKTGLTNLYDADMTWKAEGGGVSWPPRDEINQILQEQLGLELVPSRESVEMLIIDKVK